MKNGLSVAVLLIIASGFSTTGRADDILLRAGSCRESGQSFFLYASSLPLEEGQTLTVMTGEVDPVTALNRSTEGIWHEADQRIEFPAYWRPQTLSAASCKIETRAPIRIDLQWLQSTVNPADDILMYIQSYFVYEMPDPSRNEDIDQMVRDHDAYPVKVHILCRRDENPLSPVACSQVRILDQIIPIDPDTTRL